MADVVSGGGGWWPPGAGEPGTDWTYERCDLRLILDDGEDQIDVLQVTPAGPRALCSVPVAALACLLAQAHASAAPEPGGAR